MDLTPLVAGPGPGKIDTQLCAFSGNASLVHGDKGTQQSDPRVGSGPDRLRHRGKEVLAAVGVDRVVAGMRCNHDAFRIATLGESGSNREHDTVAERNYCPLHRLLLVVSLGDVTPGFQKIRRKLLGNETERGDTVGNPRLRTVPGGHREFPRMMLGPVVEAQAGDHLMHAKGVVEGGDRIHPAAEQDDDLHRDFLAPREASCRASTRMPMPPRGAKSPMTTALRGATAATTSERILLVIASAKTA